ncbi:MAG TPA: TPM domain-containing protein [Candidatus Cloacimonadota bacterium]|nr:TPM domain-containing protein [Candidatus Cloacimonadota bacterium]
MAKFKLNEADKKKISAAVRQAESTTSGEIVTAFVKESNDYAVYELTFSVIVSFIYFVVMLFFLRPIAVWLPSFFWDYSASYLVAFYGFSTFVVGTLVYFLANYAPIDRLIVPAKIQQKKVHERTLLHFMESGISYTRDRTGILIFISLLERRVELLADSGINEKIEPKEWQNIVDHVIKGIKTGSFTENLVVAVSDCGKLLSEHFPIQKDDTNELSNEIEELKS